jgi:hypothetical protein
MVIELFTPEGFAHDYEWTTRSLGMKHIAIWNDTCVFYFSVAGDTLADRMLIPKCSSRSHPEVTNPNYPEGFQGEQIPVHGPYVAELIEDRADGFLP